MDKKYSMKKKYLIIGSGFSGSVLAHQLVNSTDCTVEIWDERQHIGGNCFTERDRHTGVLVHTYGPHIFNTDRKEIWDYINKFTEMIPFVNRVKAVHNGCVYSLPINLHTINQFFSKSLNPSEASKFIAELSDATIDDPANFEEQALKFLGNDLYKAFFYGYTKKQWGCEPSELPASILKRLPVRFNYNDNYYNNPYQGIPKNGYTEIFERMLNHPAIKLRLNKKYAPGTDVSEFDHVFYTGPIDAFFEYEFGRLSYRTVTFEKHIAQGDYQGNAVINYCEPDIPFTRVHEHKHFTPWEEHEQTVYFKEYSKETCDGDIPYYPKRLGPDRDKLLLYRQKAASQTRVSFLGRLATYRYMDMHHVIGEALNFSVQFIGAFQRNEPLPIFPNEEN